MKHLVPTKTAAFIAAGALALAGCGSSAADHAGTNLETTAEDSDEEEAANDADDEEATAGDEEEAGDDSGDDQEVAAENDADDEEAVEEAAEEAVDEENEGGWKVPTTPYSESADVQPDGEANGIWSVVAHEPECGVEIELSEYSFLEDAEAQGQWCEVQVEATNDADQPLDFYMDTDIAVVDIDGRVFTPDSDATIEVNEEIYSETQVGQTFSLTVMFDTPEGIELAGVAMTPAWTFEDVDPIVWAD